MERIPGAGLTALAHLVLGVTSLWGILKVGHLPYAALGFLLYFLHGLLGAVAYGVTESSGDVYKAYRSVVVWSLSLGLPLCVSQVYVNAGFSERLAIVHFLLPLGYILVWGRHPLKSRPPPVPLESVHCLYLSFLLYVSLVNGFHYGLSTTASFAIAFCLIGTSGTVKNVPARDLFSYALSFSVYFLVRTLEAE